MSVCEAPGQLPGGEERRSPGCVVAGGTWAGPQGRGQEALAADGGGGEGPSWHRIFIPTQVSSVLGGSCGRGRGHHWAWPCSPRAVRNRGLFR